ncbi:MAG: baseplate J/gp47 family protein [Acetobacteraceae bacterium]|nr:baseplate J/gp47 family protein [Acetobacteraceae bacterium]
MQLSLQTFSSLIQNMAAAVQSAAKQLIDLSVGSTIRAILEANASIALWMQWLIVQVLQTTRASSSTGTDLDSWVADFSLTRLPAVPASGTVTFSRITPTQSAFIPVGALVRTADGTQTFSVVPSTSNAAFSLAQSGYTVLAGVAGLTVPVVAQNPGSAGNVQAGSISLLATALPGVDSVTNTAAFQNGMDSETDEALRSRFQFFINSRSQATLTAVANAIISTQQGLQYTIQENVTPTGTLRLGNFVITVDDGSGMPSTSLLAAVQSAVDAVRPIGSTFSVQPPQLFAANISISINTSTATSKQTAATNVASAVTNYIDGLNVGFPLALTKLAQIAYQADPSITNVTQILINSGSTDLVPGQAGVIKAGLVAVD